MNGKRLPIRDAEQAPFVACCLSRKRRFADMVYSCKQTVRLCRTGDSDAPILVSKNYVCLASVFVRLPSGEALLFRPTIKRTVTVSPVVS